MVVLPDWVPPETSTLSPAATAASRKRAAAGGSVPSRTRSATDAAGATNFRTLTARCRPVTSGSTACSRDPSGRVASTNGSPRSSRRPLVRSIRSTSSATSAAVSTVVVSSLRPRRATKTLPGSLTQTSSTSGSSSQRCSGPKPATASSTARATRGGSSTGGSAEASARRE